VPGCGSPYLYWHHFDPPWREREHHEPQGMIALCGLHHPQADSGAYTKEQLLEMKARGATANQEVHGRLEWMREELLTVVAGNFYYETPAPVRFRDRNVVGLSRDEDGQLLLETNMRRRAPDGLTDARCVADPLVSSSYLQMAKAVASSIGRWRVLDA
jgi:hypothetical protein